MAVIPRSSASNQMTIGILAALGSYLFFSCMDALAKHLGETYAVVQIVFFRALFGFLPVFLVAIREKRQGWYRTRKPLYHLARGIFILISLMTFFLGLKYLPLAEAVAISFTAPLFMTALAGPVIGEKVGWRRWSAVIVGFLGVVVMTRPDVDNLQVEALYILISALTFAFVALMTRGLARAEPSSTIMLYSTCSQFFPTAVVVAFFWTAPNLGDLGLFLAMGLLGGTALFLLTIAYRYAEASLLAPLEYTALIWAVLLGWLGWNHLPLPSFWYGAAIVVGAGLFIAHRESQIAKQGDS